MRTLTRPTVEAPSIEAQEVSRHTHRRLIPALVGLGLASLALYALALARPYALPRFVDQPLRDLGKLGGYGLADGLRFAAPLGAIWILYGLACAVASRAVAGEPAARRLPVVAWGGTIAFSLVLLWLYPITAADIFNYVLYGLAQHRGANPLITPPAGVIEPSLLAFSAWPTHPSPYGPLWQWFAFAVTALTGPELLGGVLAFKIALIGCHLLNTGLVARLADRAGALQPLGAALWYGWNPLVLFEVAGNGHNDVVMLTALLLALLALTGATDRRPLALPLATLGALAKFVAWLWIPPLVLGVWSAPGHRAGARTMVVAIGGCALLAAVCYAPFWSGGEALTGLRRQADLYTTSLGGLVMIEFVEERNAIAPRTLLDLLKIVGAAALAFTFVLRRPRRGELSEVTAALFDLTLVYLLVGALWFQPWYLVPLVGLAALLDQARRVVATMYALGATASYVVYFYIWPWLGWGHDRFVVQGLAVAAAHGPVWFALAALTGWRFGRWLRSRRDAAAVASQVV